MGAAVLAAAAFATGACGGNVSEGRLGTGSAASTTRAGAPVEVINTTTTAPSVAARTGSGAAAGTSTTASPADPAKQTQALVDCLRAGGITVSAPGTDSAGKLVYDQSALARIIQDPANQAAAQRCSTQSP